MSSSTEAPFSLTIKIGPNNDLLTGRAETVEEMQERIKQLYSIASLISGKGQAPADDTARAVENLGAAGIATEVISDGGAIETKTDKWGNSFTKGSPDAGSCAHGARIVANKTNKAGRKYKAYACVNDTPFGDWKQDKCEPEWPN